MTDMNYGAGHDAEIQATLSLLANAQPDAGLEHRIRLRLAEAGPVAVHQSWRGFFSSKTDSFFHTKKLAASLLAVTALVAGVLAYNSHRSPLPTPSPMPITRTLPNTPGFGSAGAIRMAPQTTKPALHPHARGAHASHGRAAIGNRHKPLPPGVAVPNAPAPAQP